MRLIDADAFKDYIRGACEDMKHLFKDNADFAKLITESFCKDIDEQPTIQSVNNSEIPNSSDTISRAKAIEALDKRFDSIPMEQTSEILMLRKDLRDLPPAQPERIKGHWVEIALSNHTYKCSVCGRLLVNITDGKNNVAKKYPYCHCGADMREVTT